MNGVNWSGPDRQPCPSCGRSERDKTLGVTLDERGGVAHCFRCGYSEAMGRERREALPRLPAPKSTTKRERLNAYGLDLWHECRPLHGAALAYLRARRCVIPPADGDLRLHPALKHPPSGILGPALVALVTDAVTREPLTLHRTWVMPDGTKAKLDPPRMLLGGHRKAGGVVRLWPDEAVTSGLGIAEGIETALSLAHAYRPAWALIDAGNLAALPVLGGVECLVIAADNDEAGAAAAESCGQRWADAGREVHIVESPEAGFDINDEAMAA